MTRNNSFECQMVDSEPGANKGEVNDNHNSRSDRPSDSNDSQGTVEKPGEDVHFENRPEISTIRMERRNDER